jgi:ABC-2 type transport system permease protein
MRLHTLRAVAWKELQVLAKDRGTLAVLFILPLLFGSLMGTVFGGAASGDGEQDPGIHIGIYAVNEDTGPYGDQVVAVLRDMTILELDTTVDATAADRLVGDGEKLAAVLIPADFSERIDAYRQATVRVLVDPVQKEYGRIVTGLVNYAVSPATVQGEIQYGIRTMLEEAGVLQDNPARMQAAVAQSTGVVMTQLQAMLTEPAIAMQTEAVAGAKPTAPTSVFSLVMPGMSVAFAFWVAGQVALTLHREKDQGTLRRLLGAPVSRGEIITGDILAYMIVVFLQVVVLFSVASGVFGMPLGDEPLGIILIALALGLTVSAFGLMVGSLTRTGKQADSIAFLLGFVLGGLSGALVITWPPFYRAESWLGTLARLTPHGPALEGYTRLLVERGDLADVLAPVGILLLYALVYASVAAFRIRRLWQ